MYIAFIIPIALGLGVYLFGRHSGPPRPARAAVDSQT
jgi:hypothetical protein